MGALGLVPVLGARLPTAARARARLRRAEGLVKEGDVEGSSLLFLLAWAAGVRKRELGALAERLAIGGASGSVVRRWTDTSRRLVSLQAEQRPSRLRRLVSNLSPAEIGALASGLRP